MNEPGDIFNSLREYDVKPPKEIMIRIFNLLNADSKNETENISVGQLNQLQELEIRPPLYAYPAIEQRIVSSFQLLYLKDFEVSPPPAIYNSIIEKIEKDGIRRKSGGAVVISLVNRYRAAAAVILLAAIGWFVFQLAGTPATLPQDVAKTVTPAIDKKADTVQTIVVHDNKTNLASLPHKKRTKVKTKSIQPQEEKLMATVGEFYFPVINNDVLASFASFDYRHLPPFLTEGEPQAFMIRLDQYTAINVSGNMNKMLRRMNQYRNNGSLKARAKRTRSRLEKWKQADTEQFDRSLINNPIDPLDLAEFIFK